MPAKTIQIFLADGDPSGIRIAELTTRTVLAVAFPRTRLPEFLIRPESSHIATYFLFGGESYVFTEDYLFSSPSGAAGIALARHTNGWLDWKNKEGRTLDEIKRQSSIS